MKKIKLLLASTTTCIVALSPIIATCSCNKGPQYKSILITSKPNKTVYAKGELLDLTGLEITAISSTGDTKVLTESEYTSSIASGTALTQEGSNTITITSKGIDIAQPTVTFNINVTSAKITNLEIATPATQWVYSSGDTLDLTGMKIKATYSDGTIDEDLPSSKYLTWPANGQKVYEGDNLLQDFYVYTPDYSVLLKSEIMVTSAPKNFADASWNEILQWVSYYYRSDKVANFNKIMCEHFNLAYIEGQGLKPFIGQTNKIKVNNVEHEVEIIGVEHDTIAEGETLAGQKSLFTFRFKNLLCSNASGSTITKKWTTASTNYDYLNSEVKNYVSTTVLNMIETDVKNQIKLVNKEAMNGNSYTITAYTDKLWLPTSTELGDETNTGGTKYDRLATQANRIAYKTGGSSTDAYWIATQNKTSTNMVYRVGGDGVVYKQNVITTESDCIAPFFCI